MASRLCVCVCVVQGAEVLDAQLARSPAHITVRKRVAHPGPRVHHFRPNSPPLRTLPPAPRPLGSPGSRDALKVS
ncbi:hypothetical protein LY76DRAFT_596320 [Colletotrichum caudatum]|nr:hypothetical protein LY76DRAFT_596320 [Colletotrichum caudatum]